jgi:hypothetical protein
VIPLNDVSILLCKFPFAQNKISLHTRKRDFCFRIFSPIFLERKTESSLDIYYFVDKDGNIHSREFLAEEIVDDDTKN